MPLKITLAEGDRIVVNGAVITNHGRRTTISIDNRSEVVRGDDLIQPEQADTPVREIYYLIQNGIIAPQTRDDAIPQIQERMANLVRDLSSHHVGCVMAAANFISTGDFYKALKQVQMVMRDEDRVRVKTEQAARG